MDHKALIYRSKRDYVQYFGNPILLSWTIRRRFTEVNEIMCSTSVTILLSWTIRAIWEYFGNQSCIAQNYRSKQVFEQYFGNPILHGQIPKKNSIVNVSSKSGQARKAQYFAERYLTSINIKEDTV